MDHSKIIDKIKKLLALATSPEAHEAAAALARARELMSEYQVTERDLVEAAIAESKVFATNTHKVPQYLFNLAQVVARLFECRTYQEIDFEWLRFKARPRSSFVFVGFSPHQEVARYCFEVLHTKLKEARQAYRPASRKRHTLARKRDEYCGAWVMAVGNKIAHLIPPPVAHEGTGLLPLDALDVYLSENGLTPANTRKSKTRRKATEHQIKGYMDGNAVEVHKPIHDRNASGALKSGH